MTIQAQRQGKEVQGTWTLNGSSGTLQGEILREAKEQIPRQPQSPVQDPPLGEWWGRFIAPVAPYALRGICWDQGESGTNVPGVDLPTLMPALVAGWRQSWEDLNLPWIFVQKPSGGGWRWQPGQQTLISRPQQPAITPDLLSQGFERENYQRLMQLPRSGMVNCLDLDDGLHPLGKEAYARRMVAIAEHLAYGGPQNTLAPVLKEIQVKGQTLRLVFDHHGRGLRALGGEPLQGFMIAGEDRVFTWAEARIEADTVVLSTQIPKPVAARYAWAQQVPWANLADGDGRLVLTFRTDDWPQPPIPAKR
jgi:sialate O-acetylesterase